MAFQFKHCGQIVVAPTVEEDQVRLCLLCQGSGTQDSG